MSERRDSRRDHDTARAQPVPVLELQGEAVPVVDPSDEARIGLGNDLTTEPTAIGDETVQRNRFGDGTAVRRAVCIEIERLGRDQRCSRRHRATGGACPRAFGVPRSPWDDREGERRGRSRHEGGRRPPARMGLRRRPPRHMRRGRASFGESVARDRGTSNWTNGQKRCQQVRRDEPSGPTSPIVAFTPAQFSSTLRTDADPDRLDPLPLPPRWGFATRVYQLARQLTQWTT